MYGSGLRGLIIEKKIVALGDLHCGSWSGLTPPMYQYPTYGGTDERNKKGRFEEESWNRYTQIVDRIRPPIDLLIANGDLIDGRGEKSGSRELITTNIDGQVEMAVECLKVWEARKVVCIYGTAYHSGALEDREVAIAKKLNGEIHSHPFIKIEDVIFDVKHKTSRSSIPHGRGTPIAKERLWNVLWNMEDERQPLADILLRSHIHYYNYIGGEGWLAMTLPALQGSTVYGAREVAGTVNWGVVEFRVDGKQYEWIAHLVHLRGFKQEVIQVCETKNIRIL